MSRKIIRIETRGLLLVVAVGVLASCGSLRRPMFAADAPPRVLAELFALESDGDTYALRLKHPPPTVVTLPALPPAVANSTQDFTFSPRVSAFLLGDGRMGVHLRGYVPNPEAYFGGGIDWFFILSEDGRAISSGGLRRFQRMEIRLGCHEANADHYILADVNRDGLIDIGIVNERFHCPDPLHDPKKTFNQKVIQWHTLRGRAGWRHDPAIDGVLPTGYRDLPLIGPRGSLVNYTFIELVAYHTWLSILPSAWQPGDPPLLLILLIVNCFASASHAVGTSWNASTKKEHPMLNKFHSPMCPALAWLFCLVAPTGASATSTSKTMAATQTHVAQETNLTRAKRLLVVDPPFELKSEAREIGQFEYARVQKPLETKQFHELEAYAALLREKKPTFSSGRSLLYYFYDKIATRDSGYSLVRKQHMNGRTRVLYYKELVAEWQRQMPESLTARFVEGLLEHEMAWVVRRSRPASNMSGEEYSTFEDQEAKAEKIFLELDTKGFADPHLYTALLYVGRSLDRSPDILNGYLKKGIAIDPTYESIYIAMANVLLPRWGGSEKELHDFAVWASDSTKKALGDIIYVRLAYVARLTSGDRLKTRYNFSWERINRGFLDLHERFPLSNPIWQQHAWFTCHYEDREMAKLLLPHLRFYTNEVEKTFWRPTMEAWGSEEEFQRCKAWLGSQTSEKSSD